MKPAINEGWRVWLLAIAGAGAALLVALGLFRVPRPVPEPVAVPAVRPATIGFKPPNDARDELNLLDPTPLFLPTKWNARPNAEPANALRELGGGFDYYSANYTFAEDAAKLVFPPTVTIPDTPVNALAMGTPEMPFLGMGRRDRPVAAPTARAALMEVVSATDGRQVWRQDLQGVPSPGEGDLYWLEFLAVVDSTGLVGTPALTTSSGRGEVDGFFQNYLAKVLRVGERLPPGFYRIKVGP